MNDSAPSIYRGRLAPSPTGFLHLGHAHTFWRAFQRSRQFSGTLIFRNDDLDLARSRSEFLTAAIEDLHWLGMDWQEGPDVGGPHAPYNQGQRHALYQTAFEQLRNSCHLYPCYCTRKELHSSANAPHAADDGLIYPGTCRNTPFRPHQKCAWRFRVLDGETISFRDANVGPQSFVLGRHFGDFVVWRQDGSASYQLATVVDDHEMQITEVVRGEDLLVSTGRQLLLYRALAFAPPAFYHCPLIRDDHGERLAKRHDALSLRFLREHGISPDAVRDHLMQKPYRPFLMA